MLDLFTPDRLRPARVKAFDAPGAHLRKLATDQTFDISDLDVLSFDAAVRSRLGSWLARVSDGSAHTSVVACTRLDRFGGRSAVRPTLDLQRTLFVTVFGPDGIDVRVVVTHDRPVLASRRGAVQVPDLDEHTFAEIGASQFLPYHGLGVTSVSGYWLHTEALPERFNLHRVGIPRRAVAVTPHVLDTPAVRAALNTRR